MNWQNIVLMTQLVIILFLAYGNAKQLKEAWRYAELWKQLCEVRMNLHMELNQRYWKLRDTATPKWQWEEPINPEVFAVWGLPVLSGINWTGSFGVPRLPGTPIFTLDLPMSHPDFTFKVGRDGITPVPKSTIEAKDGDMVQPKDGEQWIKDHKKDNDK